MINQNFDNKIKHALYLLTLCLSGGAAGGICEKATTFRDGKTKSLNTGVVTFINYNKKLVKKISEIVFTHQTGHSFGSPVRSIKLLFR